MLPFTLFPYERTHSKGFYYYIFLILIEIYIPFLNKQVEFLRIQLNKNCSNAKTYFMVFLTT